MRSCITVVVLTAGFAFASPAPTRAAPSGEAAEPAVPGLVSSQAFDPSGWTKLGQAVITGRETAVVIALRANKAPIDQLTVVVDGDVELAGATVVAGGGKRIVTGAQHHFWVSAPTKQIDLPQIERRLRALTVLYKLPAAATATVTVYGRDRSTAQASATGIKSEDAPAHLVNATTTTDSAATGISTRSGWTRLGDRTVDGKRDTDVVRVPRDTAGMFTQLAIVVTGGDLELHAMKLRFDGGQAADIDSTYYFRGDDMHRILSLPSTSGTSVLRVVQLKYGTDRGHGKTKVELWAR